MKEISLICVIAFCSSYHAFCQTAKPDVLKTIIEEKLLDENKFINAESEYATVDYLIRFDCKGYDSILENRGTLNSVSISFGKEIFIDPGTYTPSGKINDSVSVTYERPTNIHRHLMTYSGFEISDEQCNSKEDWHSFSLTNQEDVDFIQIRIAGDDPFWLDRVELRSDSREEGTDFNNSKAYGSWGDELGKGYCFSTNKQDTNGSFKDYITYRGCHRCYEFNVKTRAVTTCKAFTDTWKLAEK